MATPIRHIRSSVAGKIPTNVDIDGGMIAINVRDGKLYTVQDDGAGGKSVVRLDNGALRGWLSGQSYKIGDVVLVDYNSAWRLYRAEKAFTSGGAAFPGTQAVDVDWIEVSPGGAGGGSVVAGLGLTLSGNVLNVNTADANRIAVNANDIDLAQTPVSPGTYDVVTVDAYGRTTAGSNPARAGAGLAQTGLTLDVVGNAGRIVVNANDVDLATVGTAGTYRQVTTDAYGRVASGANPTTLAGYGIVDAQPLDATLTALANLATAADQLLYATGSDAFAVTALSSFARTILDDLTAAAARTTLELGTIATQNANNVSISGGTISSAALSGGTSTNLGISGGTISGAAISGGTATGVAISGGTISGAAISGGTVSGAAISNGTASGVAISGGTVDNASISRSSFAEWSSGVGYTVGDFVLATYESELRAFKAITNHTSSGGAFPGGQTLALPSNNFVGDWQEISPLRGTFGQVSFGQDFAFSSSISPPALTAAVNDYNPTGLQTCNFIRLTSTTNVNITGLTAPNPSRNQALFICNVGTQFNITVVNESTASLAANRFLLGTSKTLQRDEGILLIYDDVSTRWRSQAIQI